MPLSDWRAQLKQVLPDGSLRLYRRAIRRFRRARDERRYAGVPMQQVFHDMFEHNRWGDKSSVSGSGSNAESTATIRRVLPELLRDLGARSLLDVPCGDFHWMADVDLAGIDYIGGDIVPELVARLNRQHAKPGRRFLVLNLADDPLPEADVVFCRDCLVHLSFAHAGSALANIRRSRATWLVTTTFPTCRRNDDIATGSWRPLNLELPPFSLPAPERLVSEECREGAGAPYADKALGVWRIDALR